MRPPSGRGGAELAVQVDSRPVPTPLDGPFAHPAHRPDLGEGEPAEELEVHHLGELRIELAIYRGKQSGVEITCR